MGYSKLSLLEIEPPTLLLVDPREKELLVVLLLREFSSQAFCLPDGLFSVLHRSMSSGGGVDNGHLWTGLCMHPENLCCMSAAD